MEERPIQSTIIILHPINNKVVSKCLGTNILFHKLCVSSLFIVFFKKWHDALRAKQTQYQTLCVRCPSMYKELATILVVLLVHALLKLHFVLFERSCRHLLQERIIAPGRPLPCASSTRRNA